MMKTDEHNNQHNTKEKLEIDKETLACAGGGASFVRCENRVACPNFGHLPKLEKK